MQIDTRPEDFEPGLVVALGLGDKATVADFTPAALAAAVRPWEPADEVSGISHHQFGQAYRGIAYANCGGLILNTSVDISWQLQGVTDAASVSALTLTLAADIERWFERKKKPGAGIWVLEDGATRRFHTHMLWHVPSDLTDEFSRYVSRAVSGLLGNAELVDSPDAKTLLVSSRGQIVADQWARFRYMMKGIDVRLHWPATADQPLVLLRQHIELTGEQRYRFGGFIREPRFGLSASISDAVVSLGRAKNGLPKMRITRDYKDLYSERFLRWHHGHAAPLE